jgi:outer membrane protein TolC
VQLQADLSKCRYRLTNCHNSLNNALVTLKDVMFWPVDEPMKIDDSVPFLTGLSTPDSTTISVGLSHCGSRITPTEDVSMLVNHAKQWLPKVVLAKGAITNARIALKTARWQVAPSLSLNGGWSSSYFTYPGQQGYRPVPFPEQIRNNGGEYVQLSLSIPIYSHLAIFSNIEKRKNELKRASARYEQVVQEVEAEVQRAVADRDAAAEALQEAMLRASLQGESLELNRKRFEQGAISAVEYRTISDDYLTAVAEQLNARLQYFIKSYVVRYYAGERQLTVDN